MDSVATPANLRLPVIRPATSLVPLEPLELPAMHPPADAPALGISGEELRRRNTLRTSSYTIYVDLPGDPDGMLLVHGYTGAYDRVSRRVATYLRSLESRHAPRPLYGDWSPEPALDGEVARPSDETIAVLAQRGYLVALTPEEEEALFTRVATRLHHGALRGAPSYVLMPTYQCNLRCAYCFQDHMRTDPAFGHLLRVMDVPMAERILRGMRRIEAAHGIAEDAAITRRITFFGGEPLLASSRPVIEHFINRLRELGQASFTAITNATELDAYRDLLGPERIQVVQVTIDGPPSEHDARRIYADGSGSFARIAANITMALEQGAQVSVRMNIDRGNIEQLPLLAEEFHARGWLEHPRFASYVAAIHASNEHVDPKSTFTSWQLGRAMEELAQRFPRLARVGVTDDAMKHQARAIFDRAGEGRAHPGFRAAFCGANATMYVIDAFADIYACWERTGDPGLRIGHIEESGAVLMNRAVLERWRRRSVVSNPVCRKCRYAASCGGGCAVYAEQASGDAYTNHCDGYAKRFRASVAEAYLAYLRGERQETEVLRLCEA